MDTGRWTAGRLDGWKNGGMDQWSNGQMDGGLDRQTDKWMDGWICVLEEHQTIVMLRIFPEREFSGVRVSNNFRHFVYKLKTENENAPQPVSSQFSIVLRIASYRFGCTFFESSANYLKIPKTKNWNSRRSSSTSIWEIVRVGFWDSAVFDILRSHLVNAASFRSASASRAKNMKLKINLTFLCATLVGLLSIILLTQTATTEAFGGGGTSGQGSAAASCKELSKCRI